MAGWKTAGRMAPRRIGWMANLTAASSCLARSMAVWTFTMLHVRYFGASNLDAPLMKLQPFATAVYRGCSNCIEGAATFAYQMTPSASWYNRNAVIDGGRDKE